MKKSIKSALLSGLVFPGAGQLYLKKYRMASLLIVTVLACLYFIITEAIEQAMNILQQIEASGSVINPSNIVEMSTRAASNADGTTTSIATLLIAICWFVGIVHAYLSGKQNTTRQNS